MPFGFAGALALLFIVLKLGDVITWSWLWVLSPLWLPLLLLCLFCLIVGVWDDVRDNRNAYLHR